VVVSSAPVLQVGTVGVDGYLGYGVISFFWGEREMRVSSSLKIRVERLLLYMGKQFFIELDTDAISFLSGTKLREMGGEYIPSIFEQFFAPKLENSLKSVITSMCRERLRVTRRK
jgi:hypothetical protein